MAEDAVITSAVMKKQNTEANEVIKDNFPVIWLIDADLLFHIGRFQTKFVVRLLIFVLYSTEFFRFDLKFARKIV